MPGQASPPNWCHHPPAKHICTVNSISNSFIPHMKIMKMVAVASMDLKASSKDSINLSLQVIALDSPSANDASACKSNEGRNPAQKPFRLGVEEKRRIQSISCFIAFWNCIDSAQVLLKQWMTCLFLSKSATGNGKLWHPWPSKSCTVPV